MLPLLPINALHERHIGLTPPLSDSFTEAATVCFARHHKSPVNVVVENPNNSRLKVEFADPDSRTKSAWANDIDATEAGAYCVCLAAVEAVEQLVAVRRAETLTGADWFVAYLNRLLKYSTDTQLTEITTSWNALRAAFLTN